MGTTPHAASGGHTASLLSISVTWERDPICAFHRCPPRAFTVGEHRADFLLPAGVLGAARADLARIERGRVIARVPEGASGELSLSDGSRRALAGGEEVALESGARARIDVGAFAFELAIEAAPPRFRGFHLKRRFVPFFLGSILIHAGIIGCSARAPSPEEESTLQDNARLLQQMFHAAAEREEAEPTEGRRAKGEEGASGRYGISGVPSAHEARAAALRDAAEFGSIGLLQPNAPALEWRGAAGGGRGHPDGDADLAEGLDSSANEFADNGVNPPVDPAKDRVSTFAVDVDTGAYAVTRRWLRGGSLPPPAAVRAEELVNSFDYGYEGPAEGDERPFAVHLAAAPSPFARGHHVLRVGVQGRRVTREERRPVHLVYLVDTSGSMQSDDRIGLAKKGLAMLTGGLKPGDTVALCTYAGSVREVLPPTGIEERARILAAIEDLTSGGGTAMASGIENAYRLAERSFVRGEINRVIVLSDGDANIGDTSADAILARIKEYRQKGITLSTIGFGTGNYKDAMMERLADAGDGNYTYIDDERQARRVFGERAGGMLEVIARDVKIQVEFDPALVSTYRLIGYENRDVADSDFREDSVDGGEIGAGHSVTALYDVAFKNAAWSTRAPLATVRIRHKPALEGDHAEESEYSLDARSAFKSLDAAPRDLRLATAVAGFAEVLRRSPHVGLDLADVERLARGAARDAEDEQELVELVGRARRLWLSVHVEPR